MSCCLMRRLLQRCEDFLVEDDEVIEDFDAFLEEEIAGNSIFSPENPMKPQLLPEARLGECYAGSGAVPRQCSIREWT